MLEQGKGVITIENLYGGWGDTFSSTTPVIETLPSQYSKSSAVSFARLGYEGHLAPGMTFTNVTDASTVVTGLPLNAVVDSAGNGYFVLNDGHLVFYDLTTVFPGTIPGTNTNTPTGVTSGTYSDVALYPVASTLSPPSAVGVDEWIFWTWETNTYGDMARRKKSDPAGTFTSNYLTGLGTQTGGTAMVHAVPHPILVGQDNNVYIGNGNYLASHDPRGTTVNYQALDLKPGWTVSALSNYQNYIAILAYKQSTSLTGYFKSETKLFLWDGFSPSWNFEYYVRDNYAGNMLYDGTDLYVISYGRNATTKLKKFNGSGFATQFESPSIGTSAGIGGSDLYLNHMVWGNSGNIFAYGAPSARNAFAYSAPSGDQQSGFHWWAQPGTSSTGMVKNLRNNDLYVGASINGGYAIKISNTTSGFENTAAEFISQLYPLPTNSTITAVKFYLSKLDPSSSFKAAIIADYNASAYGSGNDLLQATISNATYGDVRYVVIPQTIQNINSFRVQILWNGAADTAAIIRRIEVEYQADPNNI